MRRNIICSKDQQYFEECKFYIEHLEIPSGYEIHISKMEDSKSMVSAYNRAIRQSEAKYKIYLHEDVFIVNRQFLKQSIALFEQDPKVGMIGMIGCKL